MKWILVVALISGVTCAGYEIYTRTVDGGVGGVPAQDEEAPAVVPAPEPPNEKITTAERPPNQNRPSQRDPVAGSRSEGPTTPPRTDLPNYIRHRVKGAIQQSEQRASGTDRY
jgi:hypothetical protein